MVEFCTVLSYSILTKFITDSFSSCNVLTEGNFGRTYSKLGALFCSKDCSPFCEGLAGQVDDPFLSDDVRYRCIPVSMSLVSSR